MHLARKSTYMGENPLANQRGVVISPSIQDVTHKRQWKRISNGRPFLLKGIQSIADARKALEVGCEGIVVSNHAGRQVDGAVGSLDVLPEIADAVGDSELPKRVPVVCTTNPPAARCRNEDHI